MGNARARGTYDDRVIQAIAAGRTKQGSAYALAPLPPHDPKAPVVKGFFRWLASHFHYAKVRSWKKRTARPRGLRTQDRRTGRTRRQRIELTGK